MAVTKYWYHIHLGTGPAFWSRLGLHTYHFSSLHLQRLLTRFCWLRGTNNVQTVAKILVRTLEYCHKVWYRKTSMVWLLPKGEKVSGYVYTRTRRTPSRTYRRTGTARRHRPRWCYAQIHPCTVSREQCHCHKTKAKWTSEHSLSSHWTHILGRFGDEAFLAIDSTTEINKEIILQNTQKTN